MEDTLLDKILSLRFTRPDTMASLTTEEIEYLITESKKVFIDQPIMLNLGAPVTILGDIHGQFFDLLRHFEFSGYPPDNNYLFLGNYVNFGKQSIETICLLLAFKIKYPENFFMLRGNHETSSMCRTYGFYDEWKRRYSTKLFQKFIDLFCYLPLAAQVEDKIFCVHGGISPSLTCLEDIEQIKRPYDIPDEGLITDLLFSNPENNEEGFKEIETVDDIKTCTYNSLAIESFWKKYDFDLIVRGNELVEDGYEFFSSRKLVTLFSACNFKGEYDNSGAQLLINDDLHWTFKILKNGTIPNYSNDNNELNETRWSTSASFSKDD